MTLFTALLLGHLIADFPLQTTRIHRLKVCSRWGLALHVLIHVGITAILLRPCFALLSLLLLLGIAHFGIDLLKLRISFQPRCLGFLVDQCAHLLVIALLAYWWGGQLDSLFPMTLLLPLIIYTTFLGFLVFGWVVACDLQDGRWGEHPLVQWARERLLYFSQYAGLPLLIALCHQLSLSDPALIIHVKRASVFQIRRVLS